MISPNTPPGTLVVCIDDAGQTDVKLVKHKLYTVSAIIDLCGEPRVTLDEHPGPRSVNCWWLHRFKPAVLPKSLTRLQTKRKISEDA